MRVSKTFEVVVKDAIEYIASLDKDLSKPQVQQLIYEICLETYRCGIAEMQEPIRIPKSDRPEPPNFERL